MSAENKIGEGKYVISVDNSGAIAQLNTFDNKVKQTSQSVSSGFKEATTSAIGLASGVFSLYLQYDHLEKAQLRIRKAGLEVSRAQEEVNKLVKDGQKDTLDYAQAMERLEIAKERQRILSDDLQQSEIALGLSVVQTGASMASAVSSIIAVTTAKAGLTTATTAGTAATWASTFAFLANPIFAAATAASIAAAVTLVATNTWGLRDAIFGAGEAAKNSNPDLENYSGIMTDVGTSASHASGSLGDLNKEMDRFATSLKKNEISDEIYTVTTAAAEGIMVLGSLEQMITRIERLNPEILLSEDTRRAPTAKKRDHDLIVALADRKSTRLNSSHVSESRMPSSA